MGGTDSSLSNSASQPADRGDIAMQGRALIRDSGFQVGSEKVVFLGGNYVFKAPPYFPPAHVVQSNAKTFATGASVMAYSPPTAPDGSRQSVKPCVRLGCMMEGAMPKRDGTIDQTWAQNLESTIKAFGDEGVYVFLDIHQDALCTTNGGEGFPWWVADEFQKTTCCCGACQSSFVASPMHPLKTCCGAPACITRPFDAEIVTEAGNSDPWRAYAVGADSGDPSRMNLGNRSIRMNNNDDGWGERLILTSQVQNLASRIYSSPFSATDKVIFFDPYVKFVEYLCRLWEKYYNVIAVELFNEPPLAGLPNVFSLLSVRRSIHSFYGAVLAALDSAEPSIMTPIVIDDWQSAVPGASKFASLLALPGVTQAASDKLRLWASRNQLIQSVHFYSPPISVSFADFVTSAKKSASQWGPSVPIFLSEYWETTAQALADRLALATDLGCSATTYWHAADTSFTQQDGWYKYPEAVTSQGTGVPVNGAGEIDPASWVAYEKTIADGTYFGGFITGAGGGQLNVLELVPKTGKDPMPTKMNSNDVASWPHNAIFCARANKCTRKT